MGNYHKYVWCVAYINRPFLSTITRDLEKFGYTQVKSYIPTVRVLRKQFKNQKHFEEVPLLFNYGFFRLTFEDACNKDFLMRMKVSIQGIYGWLYTNESPEVDEDTGMYFNKLEVATVRIKEIIMLKRACLLNSIYSSDDLSGICKDDFIILKGYPFENIPAQIVSINAKKEQVRVRLELGNGSIFNEVTVDFSNVFYSIYSNFDDPTLTDTTLEGLKDRSPREFYKAIHNTPTDHEN
jgi:hypothetical protein